MKCKIYWTDVIIFLYFHISFIMIPYFRYYDWMKYGIIVIVALYLLPKYKVIFKWKYRPVNIIMALFLVTVLVTGYINQGTLQERDPFLAAVVFSVVVFEAFFLFQYLEYKNKVGRAISLIYGLNLFYVFITDLLMFANKELVLETEGYYFIGNKFSVVYAHLLLICLYWCKKREKKFTLISKITITLMFAITVLISWYVDSSTGLVGSVILLLFIMFRNTVSSFSMKLYVPIIVLGVMCSVLLIGQTVLENPLSEFLVEEVLQRDMTLTNRTIIYANVLKIFPGHLWSGYGHGSTYEICMKLLDAPNTQNGMLELLMQYGVIGATLFLVLICFVFRQNNNQNDRLYSKPIVAMLYVYIVLASVETTLNLEFLVLLAILVACSEVDKKQFGL